MQEMICLFEQKFQSFLYWCVSPSKENLNMPNWNFKSIWNQMKNAAFRKIEPLNPSAKIRKSNFLSRKCTVQGYRYRFHRLSGAHSFAIIQLNLPFFWTVVNPWKSVYFEFDRYLRFGKTDQTLIKVLFLITLCQNNIDFN